MKNSKALFAIGIIMAGLFFACKQEGNKTPEPEKIVSKGEAGTLADISITLSILYCTAEDFDKKLVCIRPGANPCPNCAVIGNPPVPPPPQRPLPRRGNLLMKYVIEKNTLNFYGWSFDLNQADRSRDFEENPNFKMSIGAAIPTVVAVNGTQLGDFIWGYLSMARIYCNNQGANRKNFILLVPLNYDQGGTTQVKWKAFKTNQDPSVTGFKFDPMDLSNFDPIEGEPNPIPPKSFNTEWGNN